MMNGTLVQEEAEHLAARIRKEAGEERSLQIQKAFEIVLGRLPDDRRVEEVLDV